MKNRKDTAFTVELFGLFILLIIVITVISSVFVMCRAHSLQAKQLNEAVILAENAAELSSAAPDDEKLLDNLTDMDNSAGRKGRTTEDGSAEGSVVMIAASMKKYDSSADDDLYIIRVTRTYPDGKAEERSDGGTYAEDVIEVFAPAAADGDHLDMVDEAELGEPVYTLKSGTYFGPDSYAEEGGRS